MKTSTKMALGWVAFTLFCILFFGVLQANFLTDVSQKLTLLDQLEKGVGSQLDGVIASEKAVEDHLAKVAETGKVIQEHLNALISVEMEIKANAELAKEAAKIPEPAKPPKKKPWWKR